MRFLRPFACAAAFALAAPVLLVAGAEAGVTTHTVAITSGPQGTVDATSATFAFTASTRSAFACSLDTGAPAPCPAGIAASGSASYSGLAFGSHTFRVDATASGHVASAVRTWTIDSPPPPPQRTARLVVSVSGDGRVTSTPPGIDCPGDCSEEYPL